MCIQEAIDRMIRDVVRVKCSKVLMSPELYQACLDRMAARASMFGDIGPAPSDKVFVRGVPAEKRTQLIGAEYALMTEVTPTLDEQRPFHHFDTRKLLAALGYGSCQVVETVEYVAGQMLDPEVRKRVLEARVFDPE